VKVTAGLAQINGSLLPDGWLKVTCGLTACTLGSATDPTLGNEYGRTLPFYLQDLTTWLLVVYVYMPRHLLS